LFHAHQLRNQIDANKDRQEQAIFAFTIVTVIFLPISAVSSIFGMNTSDVRDMEQSQWLYWVVALPVTAFVFVAAMGMTGDLARLARWVMSLGSDSEGHHQGGMLPEKTGAREEEARRDIALARRRVRIIDQTRRRYTDL